MSVDQVRDFEITQVTKPYQEFSEFKKEKKIQKLLLYQFWPHLYCRRIILFNSIIVTYFLLFEV